jgi:hypothetical protein
VEWFFPPNAAVMTRTDPFYEALRSELAYLAIPDQAHKYVRRSLKVVDLQSNPRKQIR